MTSTPRVRAALLATLSALPGLALAHAGHDHSTPGFAAGFLHPLSGTDHLLAMVAVGLWAATALPAGRRWSAPATFVAAMATAAGVAQLGMGFAAGGTLETLLALSVVLLGLLIVAGARTGQALGLAIVSLAGALHGMAHGQELGSGAAFGSAAAGFTLASALLHGTGLWIGTGLRGLHEGLRRQAPRAIGLAVGVAGVALLAGRL